MTSNFSHEHVLLLFYAVNELLSAEIKRYECFAFAMIFLRNSDPQIGHIPLEEANEDYLIRWCLLRQ